MMVSAVLILVTGCSDAARVEVPAPSVYVEDAKVDAGVTLRIHAPEASTLTFTPAGPVPTPVAPTTWEVQAADGSYVVAVADPTGATTKLYVDVGVTGPIGGEMDGLANLPPPPPSKWLYYTVAAVFGIGTYLLVQSLKRRLKRPLPPPIPDPAHVIAHRAWAALRDRTDLDDATVARLISEIFRTWLDATESFPATKRTTREILDNLASTLTASELQSARRLLTATDLVKFAERAERANLFEQLDGDFAALVRPGRSPHV